MDQKLIALLLDCLHRDRDRLDKRLLATLSAQEWEDLIDLAADQRVRALLYHNLLMRGLEDVVPRNELQTLRAFYTQNTLRNLRYSSELKQIVTACADENIPVLVLKGIYLAHEIYEQIGLREMNDIDLLVKKEDLAQAAEIMIASGYQPSTPFSLDWTIPSMSHHLPPFIKPTVAGVEIHWSIVWPEDAPLFDILDLWNQADTVEIANTGVLCLSPEDVLLYLCFHNAKHFFEFGLRPYCDIQVVIQHFSPALDWDRVIEYARRWGWERGVYLALRLAEEWIGAEIPDVVFDALKPGQDAESIYEIARAHTFAEKIVVQKIYPNLIQYSQLSAWKKIGFLVQRFFPSREEMAYKYDVAPNSLAVLLKYPLRWRDLITKHRGVLAGIQGGDEWLTQLAAEKSALLHWFTDSQ